MFKIYRRASKRAKTKFLKIISKIMDIDYLTLMSTINSADSLNAVRRQFSTPAIYGSLGLAQSDLEKIVKTINKQERREVVPLASVAKMKNFLTRYKIESELQRPDPRMRLIEGALVYLDNDPEKLLLDSRVNLKDIIFWNIMYGIVGTQIKTSKKNKQSELEAVVEACIVLFPLIVKEINLSNSQR